MYKCELNLQSVPFENKLLQLQIVHWCAFDTYNFIVISRLVFISKIPLSVRSCVTFTAAKTLVESASCEKFSFIFTSDGRQFIFV